MFCFLYDFGKALGKDVLDCGGVDHQSLDLKQSRGDWLHAVIAEYSNSCLGVDILEGSVRQINDQGEYRFIVANVEVLSFRDQFDVVVAGEIVEHIYNMGEFLDSAWTALRENGTLLINTPNTYRVSFWLKTSLLGEEYCHPLHTCYYSPQTLSYIVSRHGYEILQLHVLPRPACSNITKIVRGVISSIRPILVETIVLVARKLPTQDKYSDKW